MKPSKEAEDVGAIDAGRRPEPVRRPRGGRKPALGQLAIENAKLSRQVEALERSNARLEELAGSVAHDLSEGLATISLFVDATEHTLGAGIESEAARALSGVRAGLERMSVLIDAELESARVGITAMPVDSAVALDAAVANLKARIDRTEAEIDADKLPWVSCDRDALTRVFQNLLANSMAAKAPGRDLQIRVSASRVGLRWRFDVEDTGTGIPAHLEEVLPGPATGPADSRHGRGLVICRRIVEAYGGAIRAARRADGGMVVSFDLLADRRPPAGRTDGGTP
jgi:light-regulated signal transduction histidine kinase (bacteriophytochrome)